jgi:predicted nuclease of predicted toxin-antitoxin system
VKFLIDNALSPIVSSILVSAGYDVIHVRDLGMQTASDSEIFGYAEKHDRCILSADTDFGTLLALRQKSKPSFILVRQEKTMPPDALGSFLATVLPSILEPLETGAIIVIGDRTIRIRPLPIIP